MLSGDFLMRGCWWACGADPGILQDPLCPASERTRFGALGSIIILGTIAGVLAGYLATDLIFFAATAIGQPSPDSLITESIRVLSGVLWGFFILNLLRLTVGLAGRHTDRFTWRPTDLLRVIGILVITAALALATVSPFQVVVTERDANARALAIRQIERLEAARSGDARALEALMPGFEEIVRSGATSEPPPLRRDCTGLADCRRVYEEIARSALSAPAVLEAQQRQQVGEADSSDRLLLATAQFDAESARQMATRFQRLDATRAQTGFFARVSLAYETNLQLSWVMLIAFWLLFVFPPSVRLLTDRSAYDFLIEHRNRRWLAAYGIEPKAYTVYGRDGRAEFVDAFHSARSVFRERQAVILAGRRYEDELRRQIAAISLARLRTPGSAGPVTSTTDAGARTVRTFIARQRIVTVQVHFVSARTIIQTPEGPVVAEPRDAVVTRATGESQPVPRTSFDAQYAAVPPLAPGQAGLYRSRPTTVRATQLVVSATVGISGRPSEVSAKAGDWLVDFGDGNLGVVAKEVFGESYELLPSSSVAEGIQTEKRVEPWQ